MVKNLNTVDRGTSIRIGSGSGNINQGAETVAIGKDAGNRDQNTNAVAIGSAAGNIGQNTNSIAIGYNAGWKGQYSSSIAIGTYTGWTGQQNDAIAIGGAAGQSGQIQGAIAIGVSSGRINQQQLAVAVGGDAGRINQGTKSIAIGESAGYSNQGSNSIAIGANSNANNNSICLNASGVALSNADEENAFYVSSIRTSALTSNILARDPVTKEIIDVGNITVTGAVGNLHQVTTIGNATTNTIEVPEVNFNTNVILSSDTSGSSIRIGCNAGSNGQNGYSVALGHNAGTFAQGDSSVAIGPDCGTVGQNNYTVAMGLGAAQYGQGTQSVAIGQGAGNNTQGIQSVAIGVSAGSNNQGTNCIALGYEAGKDNQDNNTIILNASGGVLNSTSSSGFYVSPIRYVAPTASNMETSNVLVYSGNEIINYGILPSVILFRDLTQYNSVSSNVDYNNCFNSISLSNYASVTLNFNFRQTTSPLVDSNLMIQFLDTTGTPVSVITSYNNVQNGTYSGSNTDGFYISDNISSSTFVISDFRVSVVGNGISVSGVNVTPVNNIGDTSQIHSSGGRTSSGISSASNQTYGIRIRGTDNNVEFYVDKFTILANLFV